MTNAALPPQNAQFSQGPLLLSWPALVIAVGIALLLLAVSASLVHPSLITGKWGPYLFCDELDDYAFVSRVVLDLRMRPERLNGVVLIGTAAMREALLEQQDASDFLKSKVGADVSVLSLMTGGQSGLEMTALATEVAANLNGVIVLGVSPSRLAANPIELGALVRNPRLAFQSEAFDQEARANGHTPVPYSGYYAFDNYPFFVARYWSALKHLITTPVAHWNTHPYLDMPQKGEAAWQADSKILKTRLSGYARYADNNLASYDRLLTRLAAYPNLKVVLLDIPLNPRAVREVVGIDFYAAHRQRIAAFAAAHRVAYVNLNDVASLHEADFQDWSHIRTARAQQDMTAHLFNTIVPMIRSISVKGL